MRITNGVHVQLDTILSCELLAAQGIRSNITCTYAWARDETSRDFRENIFMGCHMSNKHVLQQIFIGHHVPQRILTVFIPIIL